MSGSLLALCDLVESLEAPQMTEREAARRILMRRISMIKIEIRSMRRMLASRAKHDPSRYRLEDHITGIERSLRITRWELKQLAV
jgi:hypothetical protein